MQSQMKEQEWPAKFYNILCSEVVSNRQAKFCKFMKLDTHRTLFYKGVQCKYITNLVVAGQSFLKLYAIFQNDLVEQLGSWKIYTRIDGIEFWDKAIVVVAGQKIFGLVYQQSILKNAFMLNLDFLYLKPQDSCLVSTDGFSGKFMSIKVGKYILICVSEKTVQKYRSKVIYRNGIETVVEQCKWNRQTSSHLPYLSQIIKIKLSDFQLIETSAVKLVQDTLFFIGQSYKPIPEKLLNQPVPYGQVPQIPTMGESYQKKFYAIHLRQLFEEPKGKLLEIKADLESNCLQFYAQKSALTKQIGYFWINQQSIQFSNNKGTKEVLFLDQKEKIQILGTHKSNDGYSLFIRKGKNLLILQQKDEDLEKSNRVNLIKNVNLNDFDLKEVFYCYVTDSKVMLVSLQNQRNIVLYKSFGRFIDFQYSKNWLAVEQTDFLNDCRLLSISKGLSIDRRVFITHTKKLALQKYQAQKVRNFKSFPFLSIRKRGSKNWNICQNTSQLKLFLPSLFFCSQTSITQNKQSFSCLVCWNKKQINVFQNKQGVELLKKFQYDYNSYTIKPTNVFLINQYLIWYVQKTAKIHFLNLLKESRNQVQLPLNDQNLLKVFIVKKQKTFKKKDKDHFFLQITCCNTNSILIFEMLAKTQQFKLTHRSQNVGEGFAILYPFLDSKSYNNHRFRSITSPEYVLNFHQIVEQTKQCKIRDFALIRSAQKQLLIMATQQESLIVYEQKICSNHQLGFVYHRVTLPLSVIKNWRRGNHQQIFKNLGRNIWRVGNHILWQGSFFDCPQDFTNFFQMDNQTWTILKDGRIRMIESITDIIQGYIINQIPSKIKSQVIGFEVGSDFYCLYNKFGFEIFNKDLQSIWSPQLNNEKSEHLEMILKIKAYNNSIAMSYFEYYQDERFKDDYQSIKFKLRGYDVTHKSKSYEKDKSSEEPIIHIEFIEPDKLLLVTTSNVLINVIKSQRNLQTLRTKTFGKRSFFTAFDYIPENFSGPSYMLFGGNYGGISFHVGQWIQKDLLNQIWYDSVKCQIRNIKFFHYGKVLKAFMSDQEGNVCVMNLKPARCQKLADFNIGSCANKIFKNSNQVIFGCFDDGCIRLFNPIKLKNIDLSYLDFQDSITQQLPFIGGVNHLQYRMLNQTRRTYKLTKKGNMIDSLLLEDFFSLSRTLKKYILENAELTITDVNQNLLQYC